ncbi:putative transcriptional regulator [Salinivirga cyanobacteriivorans]|uniref:Putative transcriptional regulator n=1 Tax=Salinivirga cyanobacteriivorans TaxID=1307839 RepID=A0A0S2I3C5_9BACT|nr:helix-turn-helix transcriptional regulator [Salinivirga cyanobacteriivorans]ALO16814.1 putative transcriptional regulator [Salinivirga cyanobacteriivorans]
MEKFGLYIRTLREQAKLPLRKLASSLDIDQSTLSKIERGERQFTSDMVPKLAKVFSIEYKNLQIMFLKEKLLSDLTNQDFAIEALTEVQKELKG